MTELSINKTIEFENSQHFIFFPCTIVSFILILISFKYYFMIVRKYEKLNQN